MKLSYFAENFFHENNIAIEKRMKEWSVRSQADLVLRNMDWCNVVIGYNFGTDHISNMSRVP